jgi:hypothetical protein
MRCVVSAKELTVRSIHCSFRFSVQETYIWPGSCTDSGAGLSLIAESFGLQNYDE